MAPVDESQLFAELNKLKKSELIELIIYKKLPENACGSELLKMVMKSFDDGSEQQGNKHLIGDSVVNSRTSLNCTECDVLHREVYLLKKLVGQLEGRTQDQSDLINLLKMNNKGGSCENSRVFRSENSVNIRSGSKALGSVSGDKRVDGEKTADVNQNKKLSVGLSQNTRSKQIQMTPSAVRRKKLTVASDVTEGGSVSEKSVSAGILFAETHAVMNEYINLGKVDNIQSGSESEWHGVKNRKSKRPAALVGSNKDSGVVKGVPSYVYLHVYRVDPLTTIDDLTNMLKASFPEVKCEALTSRHPDLYASFKVAVYSSNFRAAMDASLWPYGACISRFFFPRKESMAAK